MPVAQKKSGTPSDYMDDTVLNRLEEDEDSLFDDDAEDTASSRNHAIQSGWAAAMKAVETTEGMKYVKDFRFEEEPQLVKFLDPEPFAVFRQHWINFRSGKKSFISPVNFEPSADLSADPLYTYLMMRKDKGLPPGAVSMPSKKLAFSIVNFSMESPTQQMLVVTASTVGGQLARLHEDAKTGPLDRYYWSLSKTGSGTTSSYSILPVKQRDLQEDWGISPEWAAEQESLLVAQTADDIRPASYDELLELRDEVRAQDEARES